MGAALAAVPELTEDDRRKLHNCEPLQDIGMLILLRAGSVLLHPAAGQCAGGMVVRRSPRVVRNLCPRASLSGAAPFLV